MINKMALSTNDITHAREDRNEIRESMTPAIIEFHHLYAEKQPVATSYSGLTMTNILNIQKGFHQVSERIFVEMKIPNSLKQFLWFRALNEIENKIKLNSNVPTQRITLIPMIGLALNHPSKLTCSGNMTKTNNMRPWKPDTRNTVT